MKNVENRGEVRRSQRTGKGVNLSLESPNTRRVIKASLVKSRKKKDVTMQDGVDLEAQEKKVCFGLSNTIVSVAAAVEQVAGGTRGGAGVEAKPKVVMEDAGFMETDSEITTVDAVAVAGEEEEMKAGVLMVVVAVVLLAVVVVVVVGVVVSKRMSRVRGWG